MGTTSLVSLPAVVVECASPLVDATLLAISWSMIRRELIKSSFLGPGCFVVASVPKLTYVSADVKLAGEHFEAEAP